LALIVAVSAVVVFVFQPFGQRQWTSGAILAVLVWLAMGFRRAASNDAAKPDGRRFRWRIGHGMRVFLIAELTAWLALIAYSAASPGGLMPPPKSDPAAIRILTWNILVGADSGPIWGRHDWSVRKLALGDVVQAVGPDILCVQEALIGQVKFLESKVPGHLREGVGRDDGRESGEHTAIFFNASRFERFGGGTFWLEQPSDEPPARHSLGPKRICTWVRLRDRDDGRMIRVYNAHSYLTQSAQLQASRIIMAGIKSGDSADEVVLTGDFNATPNAPSRTLLSQAALIPSAELAGARPDLPTYQFYGIRMRSLDELYASKGWISAGRWIADTKPRNTFPSDHFGVVADLLLFER
jgi:endonuclease/exonuclease/phosphatase family metal-dependent hydrolase